MTMPNRGSDLLSDPNQIPQPAPGGSETPSVHNATQIAEITAGTRTELGDQLLPSLLDEQKIKAGQLPKGSELMLLSDKPTADASRFLFLKYTVKQGSPKEYQLRQGTNALVKLTPLQLLAKLRQASELASSPMPSESSEFAALKVQISRGAVPAGTVFRLESELPTPDGRAFQLLDYEVKSHDGGIYTMRRPGAPLLRLTAGQLIAALNLVRWQSRGLVVRAVQTPPFSARHFQTDTVAPTVPTPQDARRAASSKSSSRLQQALEKQKQKARLLDGKGVNGLAHRLTTVEIPGKYRIAAATDQGINYANHNEDRVAFDAEQGLIAVLDGMGGMGSGEEAAQITGLKMLARPDNLSAALTEAHRKMQALPGNPGVCLATVNLKSGLIQHAGDAKVIVFDRLGRLKHVTEDQGQVALLLRNGLITEDQALYHPHRNVVLGGLMKNEQATLVSTKVSLQPGDRVMVMSDGISDNLTPQEIWRLTAGSPAEEAMSVISDVTAQRMGNASDIKDDTERAGGRPRLGRYTDGFKSAPKPDNRALVIADIL